MATDAIAHIQGTYLHDLPHRSDVTVTGRAVESGLNVRLVSEANVVWESMDSLPVDCSLLLPRVSDFVDLRLRLG